MRAAGRLTEVIEIYSSIVTRTDSGASQEEWNKVCSTRAYVKHMSQDREVILDEVVYPRTREFIVRYYVTVNEYDRIKYNGQMYRILSIDKRKIEQEQSIIAELVND